MNSQTILGKFQREYQASILPAERPVTVRVTTTHCTTGRRKDPENCALALAFRDAFPKVFRWVQVSKHVAYVLYQDPKKGWVIRKYRTQAATAHKIQVFDDTGYFPVGEYTFIPLPHSWSVEGKRAMNQKHKKRTGEFPRMGNRVKPAYVAPRGSGTARV